MNTQLDKKTGLQSDTINVEFVDNILNEINKVKADDKNAINVVVKDVKKLKDEILTTKHTDEEKKLIVISCEKILSNLFVYLNSKDNYYLDLIDKEIFNIKNYFNGIVTNNMESEQLTDDVKVLINNRTSNFDFSKLDLLYINLYNALNKKDKKEITVLRGRILKYLKKYDKKIDNVFEKLKPLYIIQNILDEELNDDEKKLLINNLLNKTENQDYANYFKDSINDLNSFIKKYNYICEKLNYEKIIGYVDNYKNELKRYGKDLRKQYETEFLDKNLKIGNLSKVLPKAMGTSIKILANTVKEFKETDSKRMKITKLKEAFGDIGRIISIPVVASGKLLKEYWYTLYMLTKGIIDSNLLNKNNKNKSNKNSNKVEETENLNETVIAMQNDIDESVVKKDTMTLKRAPGKEFLRQKESGITLVRPTTVAIDQGGANVDSSDDSFKKNVVMKSSISRDDLNSSRMYDVNQTGETEVRPMAVAVDQGETNVDSSDDSFKKNVVMRSSISRDGLNSSRVYDVNQTGETAATISNQEMQGESDVKVVKSNNEESNSDMTIVVEDTLEELRASNGKNQNEETVLIDNEIQNISYEEQYNNLTSFNFEERLDKLLLNDELTITYNQDNNGYVFSDGTIVSFTDEGRTITEPDGTVYFERCVDGLPVEKSITYLNNSGESNTIVLPYEFDISSIETDFASMAVPMGNQDFESKYSELISSNFEERLEQILSDVKSNKVKIIQPDTGDGNIVFSNGVILNTTNKTLTYPRVSSNTNVDNSSEENPDLIAVGQRRFSEILKEEGKPVKPIVEESNSNEGLFSGLVVVPNPNYNGFTYGSIMQQPNAACVVPVNYSEYWGPYFSQDIPEEYYDEFYIDFDKNNNGSVK